MGYDRAKATKLRPLSSKTWLCAAYENRNDTLMMPARIEAEDEEEAAKLYTQKYLAYDDTLGRTWVGVRIPRSSVWLLGTCFIEGWRKCVFEAFEKVMVEDKS